MAKAPKKMTPIEAFLAPLSALTLGAPDLEGRVLWCRDGQWSDGAGEMLEAEEIAFYAEGLLLEGFSLHWDHLFSAVGDMALIRLCFWEGEVPLLPPPPAGWQVLHKERYVAP